MYLCRAGMMMMILLRLQQVSSSNAGKAQNVHNGKIIIVNQRCLVINYVTVLV